MLDVLEHWHEELEIVYTVVGHAVHYIDGHAYTAHPGSVFAVNGESIHKVISDSSSYGRCETVDRTAYKQFISGTAHTRYPGSVFSARRAKGIIKAWLSDARNIQVC